MPANGVRAEEVGEVLGDDAEAVGFVPMDSVVVFCERRFIEISPEPVDLTEAFRDEGVVFIHRPLLACTLNDHGDQLLFLSHW